MATKKLVNLLGDYANAILAKNEYERFPDWACYTFEELDERVRKTHQALLKAIDKLEEERNKYKSIINKLGKAK